MPAGLFWQRLLARGDRKGFQIISASLADAIWSCSAAPSLALRAGFIKLVSSACNQGVHTAATCGLCISNPPCTSRRVCLQGCQKRWAHVHSCARAGQRMLCDAGRRISLPCNPSSLAMLPHSCPLVLSRARPTLWLSWRALQHKVPDRLTDASSVTQIHGITKHIGMLVTGMQGEIG